MKHVMSILVELPIGSLLVVDKAPVDFISLSLWGLLHLAGWDSTKTAMDQSPVIHTYVCILICIYIYKYMYIFIFIQAWISLDHLRFGMAMDGRF